MPIINAHVADLCSVFMDTNDFQRDKIPIASGAISACMSRAVRLSIIYIVSGLSGGEIFSSLSKQSPIVFK